MYVKQRAPGEPRAPAKPNQNKRDLTPYWENSSNLEHVIRIALPVPGIPNKRSEVMGVEKVNSSVGYNTPRWMGEVVCAAY